MITCDGKKGVRSKTPTRLSIDTCFGYVVLHVWEGNEITHTFQPGPDFLAAMANYAALDLRMRQPKEKTATPTN